MLTLIHTYSHTHTHITLLTNTFAHKHTSLLFFSPQPCREIPLYSFFCFLVMFLNFAAISLSLYSLSHTHTHTRRPFSTDHWGSMRFLDRRSSGTASLCSGTVRFWTCWLGATTCTTGPAPSNTRYPAYTLAANRKPFTKALRQTELLSLFLIAVSSCNRVKLSFFYIRSTTLYILIWINKEMFFFVRPKRKCLLLMKVFWGFP